MQTNSHLYNLYDSHMHTTYSDGRQSVTEMCHAAIEKQVKGITFTDHADMNFFAERNHLERIRQCIEEVHAARETYAGQLHISCGVELGEYLYDPKHADEILHLTDYDAILCSVHYVPEADLPQPYNRIPFRDSGTDDELTEYLRLYFDLLSKTIDAFDFDILAHLMCPVRYMTGLHQRIVHPMQFEEKIREILQKIIDRKIALEFNTGGLYEKFHFCDIFNETIFPLYKEMGGTLVTLGSDAHSTPSIANQFPAALDQLKEYGFDSYYYYINRTPIRVPI